MARRTWLEATAAVAVAKMIAAACGGASGRAAPKHPTAKTDRLATTFGSGAPIPEGLVQGFATYWEPFVEFIGENFSPDVKAVGE